MSTSNNSPLDDLEAGQQLVLTDHAADLLRQQSKALLWVQAALLLPLLATAVAGFIYLVVLFVGYESRIMMFFSFLFAFVVGWRLVRVLGAFQKYRESTQFPFTAPPITKIWQTRKLLWENICAFWLFVAIGGAMFMGAKNGGGGKPNLDFQELINSNNSITPPAVEEIIAPIKRVDAFNTSSDSSLLKLLESITTKNNK